jgi:hypothetical protein
MTLTRRSFMDNTGVDGDAYLRSDDLLNEQSDRRGRRQRFIAVLHQEPVDPPPAAVRAAIIHDQKLRGGERG